MTKKINKVSKLGNKTKIDYTRFNLLAVKFNELVSKVNELESLTTRLEATIKKVKGVSIKESKEVVSPLKKETVIKTEAKAKVEANSKPIKSNK